MQTLVGDCKVENTSLVIEKLRDLNTQEPVKSLYLKNVKINDYIFQHVHAKGKITLIINNDGTTDAKVELLK